jgi:hypothetical protein
VSDLTRFFFFASVPGSVYCFLVTNTKDDLLRARQLRTVLLDRSGDDEWENVDPSLLVQYLEGFGETIKEIADSEECQNLEPHHLLP